MRKSSKLCDSYELELQNTNRSVGSFGPDLHFIFSRLTSALLFRQEPIFLDLACTYALCRFVAFNFVYLKLTSRWMECVLFLNCFVLFDNYSVKQSV